MRLYELFESVEGFIIIEKLISRFTKILNTFDENVKAVGYETYTRKASEIISDSEATDWYLIALCGSNTKLQRSVDRLFKLRQHLVQKINSGL